MDKMGHNACVERSVVKISDSYNDAVKLLLGKVAKSFFEVCEVAQLSHSLRRLRRSLREPT